MFKPFSFEKKITVGDVYGTSSPTIPDGYEAVAFRIPEQNEAFLNALTFDVEIATCRFSVPRIILRSPRFILKLKPPKVVIGGNSTVTLSVKDIYGKDSVEIPDGYKFVAFRMPGRGELHMNIGGKVFETTYGYDSPRILVKKN